MNTIFFTAFLTALIFTYIIWKGTNQYKKRLAYWERQADNETEKRKDVQRKLEIAINDLDQFQHEKLVKEVGLYFIEPKNETTRGDDHGLLRFYVNKRVPGWRKAETIGWRDTEAEARALIKALKQAQIGVK